ncbi:MAG: hypothetical protein AB8G11_02580 [Saprospiraceae bacterium]
MDNTKDVITFEQSNNQIPRFRDTDKIGTIEQSNKSTILLVEDNTQLRNYI